MWRSPKILMTETFSARLTRNFDKQRGFVNGAMKLVVRRVQDLEQSTRKKTNRLVDLHERWGC